MYATRLWSRRCLVLLTMVCLASCSFPPPARRAVYVFNKDDAIRLAFDAIRQGEPFADDFNYDAAEAVPVKFDDGTSGVFVAFLVSGPARGFQVLLQAHGSMLTVLEIRNTAPNGWGYRRSSWNHNMPTPMEQLNWKLEAGQPERALIRVNGHGHLGTGFFDNGVFEIIDVRDKHIRVLFRGAETSDSMNPIGWSESYDFVLGEWEDKSVVQIGVRATKCTYEWLSDQSDYVKSNCHVERANYHFNGIEFVDEKDRPGGYATTEWMKK